MKKLLMAGCVLLAFCGQGHTANYARTHTPLPSSITGSWCIDQDSEDFDSWVPTTLNRCKEKWATVIKSDMYEGPRHACLIRKSERVTDSIFLINAHCDYDGGEQLHSDTRKYAQSWDENRVFQILGGQLYIRFIVNVDNNTTLSKLIASYYALDEECRGDMSDPGFGKSCELRTKTSKALEAHKYCFGKDNQPHSDMIWHRCTRGSLHNNPY